jgi:hypothetical protein
MRSRMTSGSDSEFVNELVVYHQTMMPAPARLTDSLRLATEIIIILRLVELEVRGHHLRCACLALVSYIFCLVFRHFR